MSILDKLTETDTGFRRPGWPSRPAVLSITCEQTEPEAIGGPATQFEFELRGEIAVRFFANKAQFNDAKRNAQKLFLLKLYGDIIPLLYEVRGAIFDGDPETALSALGAIEKEIGL